MVWEAWYYRGTRALEYLFGRLVVNDLEPRFCSESTRLCHGGRARRNQGNLTRPEAPGGARFHHAFQRKLTTLKTRFRPSPGDATLCASDENEMLELPGETVTVAVNF